MTYNEYWNGDVWAVKHYRDAEKERQKHKNAEFWLQGMYIYEALCDVSPILHAFAQKGTKPIAYRSEPYPLTADEETAEVDREKEQREENERLQAKIYMNQMLRAGADWGSPEI